MDIDVEHEGRRAKVTPTPPASSGPPSARSDGGSGGLLSRGGEGGPVSSSSAGSMNEGARVSEPSCCRCGWTQKS